MRGRLARFNLLGITLFLLLGSTGCTRHWYRTRADHVDEVILKSADMFPGWKIEQYHVYPDPRARFADPTNPDRPPMPPDDPAARIINPGPQKPPHRGGIARVEGTGYLTLLRSWDAHNRSLRGEVLKPDVIIQTSITQPADERVELPQPRLLAPVECKPYLLKLDQAVELGIINSRLFQDRREDLYLAALPVSLERFAFAAQFFALGEAIRETTGSQTPQGRGERWRMSGATGFSKLFSTGALLLVQFANQTAINLTGPGRHTVSVSTIDLDIVQPLLQGGGRTVTLEPLTQVERNLLYEIRDYARFRKEFFQYISGGADLVTNFSGSLGFGRASLVPGTTFLSSGNSARPLIRPGNAALLDLSTSFTPQSEGYLPTLLRKANLSIEARNLERLESVFKLFAAFEGGGRVSSLQVGRVQSQILQTRTNFYQLEQNYRDSLDRFKLQLGLPVNIDLELDDEVVKPALAQFNRYESMIEQYNKTLQDVDQLDSAEQAPQLRAKLGQILTDAPLVRTTERFRKSFPGRWQAWQRPALDDKSLAAKLSDLRRQRLKLLEEKDDRESKEQSISEADAERLRRVERELAVGNFEDALRRYEVMPWRNLPLERTRHEDQLAKFRDVRIAFSEVLGEASNERLELLRPRWPDLPGVRINEVDLVKGDLDQAYEVASRTALDGRLDLMNVRAQVHDHWRQVAVHANALMGVFNVGYHMDSRTPPDQAKLLAFSGTRTRHQLFLNLELPLVRVAERNAYRASLIAYQRARRSLMASEDLIVNQVRGEIRQLQVLAKNFKIQQQAVELAFLQVESSLETFLAPATPTGAGGGDNAASAAALTQQLLDAYARLPREQSLLLTIWINYQIARQQLYLDLELLPLDFRGVWIDEFSFPTEDLPRIRPPEQLP